MEGLTEELGRNFRFPHKPYFCLRGNENTRAVQTKCVSESQQKSRSEPSRSIQEVIAEVNGCGLAREPRTYWARIGSAGFCSPTLFQLTKQRLSVLIVVLFGSSTYLSAWGPGHDDVNRIASQRE